MTREQKRVWSGRRVGLLATMLASLLPGLRELRTPLAAGYLWLVVAYFAGGSPTEATDVHGPLHDLLTVLSALGTGATAVAVSFVAYLVGSISQDVSERGAPIVLRALSNVVPRDGDSRLSWLATMAEDLSTEQATLPSAPDLRQKLDEFVQILREMRADGASEAEKPEARRPMIEAERNLRVAILPPLTALMCLLIAEDSFAWGFGLLLVLALLIQAVVRQVEAARLAAQYYKSREAEEFEGRLATLIRALDDRTSTLDEVYVKLRALPWDSFMRHLNRQW